MSLLTLIQDATDLLALKRPTTVITTSDDQTRQLHAIARQECMELNRMNWKAMMREHTFVTTATAAQASARPSDLDRWVSNSFFNRSTRRPIVGPVTPQTWQALQASPQSGRIVLGYRERDGSFLITPTPPAGETIAGEYISTKWARNAALDTAYVRWQADSDTSYFDEYLITLGAVWRWRKSKGLPYLEDYTTYTDYKSTKLASDGGSSAIDIVRASYTMGRPTVPETGFGS